MKKYDLSKIMKKAWELRRSYHARALSFGECLKRAWMEAKNEYQNSLVPDKFTDGMEITIDGSTRTLNRWTKGGYDRVYINGGSRKGDGFVDLKKRKAILNGGLTYQVKMAEKILAMEF
ncbi:MAG: hypothetical protein HFI99_17000 [Lachnospiraceae bacterium]|jgi:hypothetical protein|nr:hypothetical protein [Lachnospiraceae bacterium]